MYFYISTNFATTTMRPDDSEYASSLVDRVTILSFLLISVVVDISDFFSVSSKNFSYYLLDEKSV